jgi:transcription elongation factor Elf1
MTKKEKFPVFCQFCGHNMSRSRVKMSTNPMTVRCNGCKTVFEVRLTFPETSQDVPITYTNPYTKYKDDHYELVCLPGNHGTWLFVWKDGKVIMEQAGFKTDEEAKAWGEKYIELDKNRETDPRMSKWHKLQADDLYPQEDPDIYIDCDLCRGCGEMLLPENRRIADGCVCNSPRGINHGLVAKNTCTCPICDPEQTGSTRYSHLPMENSL